MTLTDYPSAVDSFATLVNYVDVVDADDVNKLQEAIVAVQDELGTDPAGEESTVKDRIAAEETRFDRIFNSANPNHAVQWFSRRFSENDFENHIAGFEDEQSSPYGFGGSPGGFSLTNPGSSYAAESETYKSILRLYQYNASNPLYVEWTSATGMDQLNAQHLFVPAAVFTSDKLLYEIRLWDVQSPSAADKYWAIRLNWMGATYPAYPLRVYCYYGTGITFAIADGTKFGVDFPVPPAEFLDIQLNVYSSPSFFVKVSKNNVPYFSSNTSQAGYPAVFKTARLICPAGVNYFQSLIDDIVIS